MKQFTLANEWSEVLQELYSCNRDIKFREHQDREAELDEYDDVLQVWNSINTSLIDEIYELVDDSSVISVFQMDLDKYGINFRDNSTLYVTMADKPIFSLENVENLTPYVQ